MNPQFWQRRVKRKSTADNKQLRFLCGFRPVFIRVATSKSATPDVMEWYAGDAEWSARRIIGSSGQRQKVTVEGFSVKDLYFTLGTDARFNATDDDLIVQAYGDNSDVGIRDTSQADTRADPAQFKPVAYKALDLDVDEDRVSIIPADGPASYKFTDGEQDDISWLQREA